MYLRLVTKNELIICGLVIHTKDADRKSNNTKSTISSFVVNCSREVMMIQINKTISREKKHVNWRLLLAFSPLDLAVELGVTDVSVMRVHTCHNPADVVVPDTSTRHLCVDATEEASCKAVTVRCSLFCTCCMHSAMYTRLAFASSRCVGVVGFGMRKTWMWSFCARA